MTVKAENALVFSGREAVCKLSDLGRSKHLAEPRRFAAGEYLVGRGDWRYAPPEVLWGQFRPDETGMRRVDVYLLGSVLTSGVPGQSPPAAALGPRTAVDIARWSFSAAPDERSGAYRALLPEVNARYESAFVLFEAVVPAPVRQPVMGLLRQLCNPDPALRDSRGRSGLADLSA